MSAEAWIAIATFALAIATLVLVVVGVVQIQLVKDEARRNRTLDIVSRYDFDPVLDTALLKLAVAWQQQPAPAIGVAERPYVVTILNYLDSIAIGIEQELYIDQLARDHMAPIVKLHVRQYLGPNRVVIPDMDIGDFQSLMRLCERWSSTPISFQPKGRLWRRKKP